MKRMGHVLRAIDGILDSLIRQEDRTLPADTLKARVQKKTRCNDEEYGHALTDVHISGMVKIRPQGITRIA